MSPLGLYGALALLLGASALVGWGVLAAAGRREWSWLAPGLGLATLVVLGLAAQLPGDEVTVSVLVAAAVAASIAVLARRRPGSMPGSVVALAVVALVVLAASLPFAAGGGFEVMGTYVNNDLAFHLYNTEWLRSHEGIEPKQVADGYPLGPHGLVLALSTLSGIGLPEAWTALLMAVAVATALAALPVLARVNAPLRIAGALLVGLSFLGAAFYVQSAFKETLMALFVLGFALSLREAAGEGAASGEADEAQRRWRAWVAPGLFALAALAAYGIPGLAWPAATLVTWVGARWALERRARLRAGGAAGPSPRRLLPAAAVAAAAIAALGYLAWERSADFIGGREVAGSDAVGNLFDPIPPSQALGLWLSSDYRIVEVSFLGEGGVFTLLLAILGLVAFGLGALRLARTRELALLSALAVSAGAWIVASISLGPYVASKALAIIAPLVMLAAIVGIAPEHGESDRAWIGRALVAGAFLAVALGSTYLALAGARLDRDGHETELAQFRDEVEGHDVLFLGSDEYAAWYLRGASVLGATAAPPGLYLEGDRPGLQRTGEREDFDGYYEATLDQLDFVITTNSAYASEPPSNFEPVDSTESFTLYERVGPTQSRDTLREGDLPGATLNCDTPEGAGLSRRNATAYAFARDPVVKGSGPLFAGHFQWVPEGHRVVREMSLAPGRWEISVQYHSLEPMVVEAPGLFHVELPPNSSRLGPYWQVATIELDRRERVPFVVAPVARSGLRGMLDFERGRTGPQTILGQLAATPEPDRRFDVPLSEACGRLIDYYDLEQPAE